MRRMSCRFRLEQLEDRLTPSAPGLFGGAAEHYTQFLYGGDWSAKVNVAVINITENFQISGIIQIDFAISIPAFSAMEFQAPSVGLGSPAGLLGAQNTDSFGDAALAEPTLAQAAPLTTAAAASQGSLTHSSSNTNNTNTPSHTQQILLPPQAPITQNIANPTNTTVQTGQVSNAALTFAAVPLRTSSATPSGAADSGSVESLRIFPLDSGLVPLAVNPLAVTNPINTAPAKLTPLPASGGGNIPQADDQQAKPPVVQPGKGEQQESQELLDLFDAGLSAAFVPGNSDDAASALALVGKFEAPGAYSEVQMLLFGLIAASTVGVAYRRNRAEESEREVREAACWLRQPLHN
jgi:hypothetical protein